MKQQFTKTKSTINPFVFYGSLLVISFALLFSYLFKEEGNQFFSSLQQSIYTQLGWFYIISLNFIIVFMIYLAFSKYGKIILGGKNTQPEFNLFAWSSMLFSAGMGIGLLVFGVSEPITHFTDPPFAEAFTEEAAREAMAYTFLHWGLHPWAIYALVGLSLAFFHFNKKLPLQIRSIFYPLLGDKIHGVYGNLIDLFAVIATLFGLCTSLGYGVDQLSSGLNYLFSVEKNKILDVVLIMGISSIACISVFLGVKKGIQKLSQINVYFAIILVGFILITGPTIFIFKNFIQNTGAYFNNFIELSNWTATFENQEWQNQWTIGYWGWWIAWSPFVGMFIARISKGRSVKEFILGVMLIPTLFVFFWMASLGGSGILEIINNNNLLLDAVNQNSNQSLFVFLETSPWSALLQVLAMFLIASFFITSSDSGSLVVDSLTANGQLETPKKQRIFWALLEGVIASVLIYSGGLLILQTASVLAALPFCILLLIACYSISKSLKKELAT
ncbi:MAG: BCCT family transporter [Flavobacteriaceae bacterium]|nr:BCCT family transporter [Flavobacteriaceae bacterium]